jgi:hypothetical protein
LKKEKCRYGCEEVDDPVDAAEVGLSVNDDVDDIGFQPQTLTVQKRKCCEPQQQGIEFAAQQGKRRTENRDCSECRAKKEKRLIVMKSAQHFGGSELCIGREH